MRIPITVAIQNTLVIQAESQRFAIPLRQVVEIIEVTPDQIETAAGFLQLNLRGNLLPVYALKTLLQLNIEPPETHKKMLLVVLQHEKQYIALLVDSIDGKQDLFLRNVHQDILNIPGISGISLLGNGNAIIILDCEGLFRLTQHHVEPLYAAQ
ncbi:MAG: chemotaxis protein CheW [Cellvibrionales bacterium]|nr:chemotaxis protein CheW [Cellvibrionales bacterium]